MKSNPDDGRSPDEGGRSAGLIAAGLLLAPILYLFSIGPVARLSEEGYLPRDPVRAFYEPVVWLHHNTPLKEPLEWYGALWGWR